MKRVRHIAAAALAAFAAAQAPLAWPKAAEGGSLLCGGVGSDERAALENEAQGANLTMEFSTRRGEYVSDVEVMLSPVQPSEAGPGFLLTAEGPLCFMQVPAGRYRIEATYNGATRTTRVDVPPAPRKPVHVTLAFPEAHTPKRDP